MISDISNILSTNAKGMKRSAIRELLKLVNKPGVISFAGGFPAPDLFPIEQLQQISHEVLAEDGAKALQYGETEGDPMLRQQLLERYRAQGFNIDLKNIIIITASQQGLDLIGKNFLNPGDKYICELPSYLGALQAFNSYRGVPVGIHNSTDMEKVLEEMKQKGEKPKFIYVIPDFQNPSGVTMPKAERLKILELAKKYDVLIIEDAPYREVRFDGETQPTIFELDNTGQVVFLGTFSKTFVPGFRLGWIIAHEDVIDKMVVAKQATDLCSPSFDQKIAARFLEKGLFDKNIEKIVAAYREKRDRMIAAFEKYMPEGVKWTHPEGGLFLFVELPKHLDAADLFKMAIEENVAFVLGTDFHCDGSGKNTMRINFSYMSPDKNEEGVMRLANAVRKMLKDNPA